MTAHALGVHYTYGGCTRTAQGWGPLEPYKEYVLCEVFFFLCCR